MEKMTSFENFKNRVLQDPEMRKMYYTLGPYYALQSMMIGIRHKLGLTQSDIADSMGTQKSNISRLESALTAHSPRLDTIEKYAQALGYTLKIDLVPLEKPVKKPVRTAAANQKAVVKKSKAATAKLVTKRSIVIKSTSQRMAEKNP